MRSKLIATALGLGLFAFVGPGRASARYYGGCGNGNRDLSPHWHTTQTRFGGYTYFGNGLHDIRPHGHTAAPFNGVTSYSHGPFRLTQGYDGLAGYSGFGSYHSGYSGYGGGFNRGYGRQFNRW